MPGMITSQTCTCSVCGTTTEFPKTVHTYGLPEGPRDLDLRAPDMRQPMLDSYVQVCPCCGFAAFEVLRDTAVTRWWLTSEDYVSLEELTGEKSRRPAPVVFARRLRRLVRGPRADRPEGFPALAWDFYLAAKCYLVDGDEIRADLALQYAAWVCDDEGAEDLARMFRLRVIDLDEKALRREEGEDTKKDPRWRDRWLAVALTLPLIMRRNIIENLRRAGELDRAAAKCSETRERMSAMDLDRIPDFARPLKNFITYEEDLIKRGDTERHSEWEAARFLMRRQREADGIEERLRRENG